MSRVGKHAVKVPSNITVTLNNRDFTFKGKNATQSYNVPEGILFEHKDGEISFKPESSNKTLLSLWGTTQRNISNIIVGLDKGFTKNIELVGVGYRAAVAGTKLTLQLGFSHDVVFEIPSGVSIKCEKPTAISVTCADKQLLGQVVSKIRNYRPPEPYKGKGVICEKEFVIRKEGKKK